MKILPGKDQYKRWSLPSKYTFLGLILAICSLLYSLMKDEKETVHNETHNKNTDLSTNITNENNFYVNPSKEANLNPEKSAFSLDYKFGANIKKELLEKGINVKNSGTRISAKYSQIMVQPNKEKEVYYYPGGYIIIKVGSCERHLKEINIEYLKPTDKTTLEKNIELIIETKLEQNHSIVIDNILNCI